MVKLINPLFSINARGRVGGLVYQQGKSGSFCRVHVPQRKKPSAWQKQHNYEFGLQADAWRELTEETRQEYNTRATKLGISGFNLYVKENFIPPPE